MSALPLQQRSDAFDERNSFVQMLLGVIVLTDRFDALLAEIERADISDHVAAKDAAPDQPRTDAMLIETLLGAIALRRPIRSLLESSARPIVLDEPCTAAPVMWRDLAR